MREQVWNQNDDRVRATHSKRITKQVPNIVKGRTQDSAGVIVQWVEHFYFVCFNP